jgi:hypothetical protein
MLALCVRVYLAVYALLRLEEICLKKTYCPSVEQDYTNRRDKK